MNRKKSMIEMKVVLLQASILYLDAKHPNRAANKFRANFLNKLGLRAPNGFLQARIFLTKNLWPCYLNQGVNMHAGGKIWKSITGYLGNP